MKSDENGFLPVMGMVILVVIAILLVMSVMVVAFFTLSMILTLLFVGAGVYLFINPKLLQSLGPTAKFAVPIGLILLGVLVYTGILEVG